MRINGRRCSIQEVICSVQVHRTHIMYLPAIICFSSWENPFGWMMMWFSCCGNHDAGHIGKSQSMIFSLSSVICWITWRRLTLRCNYREWTAVTPGWMVVGCLGHMAKQVMIGMFRFIVIHSINLINVSRRTIKISLVVGCSASSPRIHENNMQNW